MCILFCSCREGGGVAYSLVACLYRLTIDHTLRSGRSKVCRGWTELAPILLLALVVRALTTHPFRDGAPFLLRTERPLTFGRSLRFFSYITLKTRLPGIFFRTV